MVSALLIGATGATGKHVLQELLASPHYTHVGEYGRRVTPLDTLPAGTQKDKLVQKVIDFDKLDEAALKEGKWDVVILTLGTTRAAAGSAEKFVQIDREYVVNAAKAAKTNEEGHKQRVVYLSSAGASSTSMLLYPQSKGLTEDGLVALGYDETIIFRPGYLADANRANHNSVLEGAYGWVTNKLSAITPSVEIKVPLLAKSIVNAGQLGAAALPKEAGATVETRKESKFTLIGNKGAIALGGFE